jgi:hypothetical protein
MTPQKEANGARGPGPSPSSSRIGRLARQKAPTMKMTQRRAHLGHRLIASPRRILDGPELLEKHLLDAGQIQELEKIDLQVDGAHQQLVPVVRHRRQRSAQRLFEARELAVRRADAARFAKREHALKLSFLRVLKRAPGDGANLELLRISGVRR